MQNETTLLPRLGHVAAAALGAGSLALFLCASPNTARAESGLTFEGILSASLQDANKNADAEGNLQLDLLFGLPMGPGSWHMEVKAGTSPQVNGVSAYYPEAAGLVGEIVDSSGNGTAAITQLYYELTPSFGTVDAGLVFSPGYLDTNDIADDEYRQFMGATFVNNPTIPLPVYTIGGAVQGSISPSLGYTVFASSTADLQGSTYGNLFDFSGKGHGVFVAGEMNWKAAGLSGNVGIWENTDESFTNFASGQSEDDYGIYGNLNGTLGSDALQWNVRAGWANPKVSQAEAFAGAELAYNSNLNLGTFTRPITYGVGASYTLASSDMPGPKADMEQLEAYSRVKVTKHASVTADVQYLDHSQFDPTQTSVWVVGLRAGVEF